MKSFRHNINERNKSNVILLRMKYGAAGYGVYMMLLERLAAEPQLRSVLDYDMLAYDFHVDAELVKHVVEDFDLFTIDLEMDCFYNEELAAQLTPKAKREQQEKLLDEFINNRLAQPRWPESVAQGYNTSPDRIRSILRTSFRTHILTTYPRLPETEHLNSLLTAHLKDLKNEKSFGGKQNFK